MEKSEFLKLMVTIVVARKFEFSKHKKIALGCILLYLAMKFYKSRQTLPPRKLYPLNGAKLKNLTMVGKHASDIGVDDLPIVVSEMRRIFQSNITRPLENRRRQILRLEKMIKENMPKIAEALQTDLHKARQSAYGEPTLALRSIRHALWEMDAKSAPESAGFSPFLPTATNLIVKEPYGTVLLHGIWNFPFELIFTPLAGALAAGNNVIIKPCNTVPNCARVMADLIHEYMDPRFVQVVGGPGIPDDRVASDKLLDNHFDKIMFTGSSNGGRFVMQKAARFLTPVLLELGGKNPVFIDSSADLALTAEEVWKGRQSNCGQICIAADYLLVERSIVDDLMVELRRVKESQMSEWRDAAKAARLVTEVQFERVREMVEKTAGDVVFGGDCDEETRHFEPTCVRFDGLPSPDEERDIGMSKETFGPVLWVVPVDSMEEAVSYVREEPKSLALYIFSYNQANIDYIVGNTASGAVVVNGIMSHYLHDGIPFGGVGESGMGAYHGRLNYDAFCHRKGVVQKWKFTLPKLIGQLLFGYAIMKG